MNSPQRSIFHPTLPQLTSYKLSRVLTQSLLVFPTSSCLTTHLLPHPFPCDIIISQVTDVVHSVKHIGRSRCPRCNNELCDMAP